MLSFFPLDVLDETWDLIESVSEGFLTYSHKNSFRKVNQRDVASKVKKGSNNSHI